MAKGRDGSGDDTRGGGTGGSGRTGRRIRFWIGGLGVALMIVLILQNQDPVAADLLFWEFRAPLFLLLSMVGGLGLLGGFLLGRFGRRGR